MIDADLIERIVREVIRRLREMEASGNAASNNQGGRETSKTLRVDDQVVALATLQGRLDGVHRLQVRGNAVVTPSVHDELRDRKITLTRGED